MKKFLMILVVLGLVVPVAFVMTACGGGRNNGDDDNGNGYDPGPHMYPLEGTYAFSHFVVRGQTFADADFVRNFGGEITGMTPAARARVADLVPQIPIEERNFVRATRAQVEYWIEFFKDIPEITAGIEDQNDIDNAIVAIEQLYDNEEISERMRDAFIELVRYLIIGEGQPSIWGALDWLMHEVTSMIWTAANFDLRLDNVVTTEFLTTELIEFQIEATAWLRDQFILEGGNFTLGDNNIVSIDGGLILYFGDDFEDEDFIMLLRWNQYNGTLTEVDGAYDQDFLIAMVFSRV